MKIALYLVVPRHRQYEPLTRTAVAALRLGLRRAADRVSWRLGGRGLSAYAWPRFAHTNKGDIAIREAVRQQLVQAAAPEEVRFEEFAWYELDEAAVARLNRDCDLFVVAGSGCFHFDGRGELAARVARDCALFRELGMPKIAYGVGVNAPAGLGALEDAMPAGAKATLRATLDCLDGVAVRDEPSRALLAGFSRSPVTVIGDPALQIQRENAGPVEAPSTGLRIGLNAAVHSGALARALPKYLSALLPVLKSVERKRPVSWRYFVHTEEERGVPELLRAAGLRVATIDGSPEEMLAAYAGLDCHICEMLHSSILAISAGVPTVNVGYDAKNLAFFSLLGVPELCVPLPELSEARLRSAVETALDDAPRIRETLRAAKSALASEQRAFLARAVAGIRVGAAG